MQGRGMLHNHITSCILRDELIGSQSAAAHTQSYSGETSSQARKSQKNGGQPPATEGCTHHAMEEMCSGRRSGWWVVLAKVSNIIRSWGRRGQMFQSGDSLRPAVTMEGVRPKSRTGLRCLEVRSVKSDWVQDWFFLGNSGQDFLGP